MAERPVFLTNENAPYFREEMTRFEFCPGFADIQRKRSAENLHKAFHLKHPDAKVLEVSRFSENYLGQSLSAFNLLTELGNGDKVPVENAFQSSKVFAFGGPYRELLYCRPAAAKKADCLQESGPLVGFNFEGADFPLEPKTFFYDWIYINALKGDQKTTEALLAFDAFTDIAFNPQKSINCQARTIAIYVSLCRAGLLGPALSSAENFRTVVYDHADEYGQMSLL